MLSTASLRFLKTQTPNTVRRGVDIFRLNRCLYSSMRYTSSYGFIPQTFALDNDPLDIVIYNNIPIQTGTLVQVKPIAVLDMTDNGDEDYKIVGVPMSHVPEYKRCAILTRTGSPPPRISSPTTRVSKTRKWR